MMRLMSHFSESPIWLLPKRAVGPLLCVLILFYLGFHAVSGERGLFAFFRETRRLEQLSAELTQVRSQREQMEKKIKLMSNASLDLDMLDERARTVLGLAGKDEVVLFTK